MRVTKSFWVLPKFVSRNVRRHCRLVRGHSLLTAWQLISTVWWPGTPSLQLPSLLALIWRLSLGMEDWPYLKVVLTPDAWFTFSLTLGIALAKTICSRSSLMGPYSHIQNLVIEPCRLVQIRVCPQNPQFIHSLNSGIKLSWFTEICLSEGCLHWCSWVASRAFCRPLCLFLFSNWWLARRLRGKRTPAPHRNFASHGLKKQRKTRTQGKGHSPQWLVPGSHFPYLDPPISRCTRLPKQCCFNFNMGKKRQLWVCWDTSNVIPNNFQSD